MKNSNSSITTPLEVNTPDTSNLPVTSETTLPKSQIPGTPSYELRQKFGRGKLPQFRNRPLKLRYKAGVVYQERYGLTNKEAAEYVGVSPGTWGHVRCHSETKELIKLMKEYAKDDHRLITDRMHDEGLHSFENLIFCRDMLLEKQDWKDAAAIDQKILEGIGFWQKQKVDVSIQGQTVTLNLGTQTEEQFLDSPSDAVETDYEIIESDEA